MAGLSAGDLVAERLPTILALLEQAADRLAELGDVLSDDWADHVAAAGGVGCRTPARALRLYSAADELHRVAERLERSLR